MGNCQVSSASLSPNALVVEINDKCSKKNQSALWASLEVRATEFQVAAQDLDFDSANHWDKSYLSQIFLNLFKVNYLIFRLFLRWDELQCLHPPSFLHTAFKW